MEGRSLGEAPTCPRLWSCSERRRPSCFLGAALTAAGLEPEGRVPRGGGAGWACSSSSGAASQAPLHEASSEEKPGSGERDLAPRQSTGGTAGNRLDLWALSPERKPHHTPGTHATHAPLSTRLTHTTRARLTPSRTAVGSPARSVRRERPWRWSHAPRSGDRIRECPPVCSQPISSRWSYYHYCRHLGEMSEDPPVHPFISSLHEQFSAVTRCQALS